MQLDPLVKPRSVAIVGATDRVGPGRSVVESLGAIGFTGAIYPVNPKYQTVLNHVCYPSLTDLPEAPDVVVFSIRKPLLPEQVRLAVKRGARAAVIYDAGFAELGEDGARQQAEIAGLCREAGMPVCGPNCMGQINCGEAQVSGYHTVNRRYVYAALHWCTNHHAEICDTVRELMGAGVFQMPADVSVLDNSDTRDAFETYWSVPGQSAKDRMKLFKLAWDLLGSDFAGRHMQNGRQSHLAAPWKAWTGLVDDLLASYDAPAPD